MARDRNGRPITERTRVRLCENLPDLDIEAGLVFWCTPEFDGHIIAEVNGSTVSIPGGSVETIE